MKKETITKLHLPKGEWLISLLQALQNSDLELEPKSGSTRDYEMRFVQESLPIVFYLLRSKEIVDDIYDPDTQANGGFTGSDITEESGITASWTFPLWDLNPQAVRPELYLGSTPNLRSKIANPDLKDLQGGSIYTSYPSIARRFLGQQGLVEPGITLKSRAGTLEGRWRTEPTNLAVIDISSSGTTRNANQIEPMAVISNPKLVFVESNLSRIDQERVADLREKIYQAVRKKFVGEEAAFYKVANGSYRNS